MRSLMQRSAYRHIKTSTLAAALFILNAFVCRELFVAEYTQHLGSIEGAYIGISRYVLGHLWDLSWFPLWYCGIPFQNTYPPLLHFLDAVLSWVFGVSPAFAYHAVTAALYCLGPVTLFLLAYGLSGDRKLSFTTALVYSVVSPSALLMGSVSADLGSVRLARRLQALVAYGDGPHVVSLTLLPLSVLALHFALKRGGPVRTYAAAAMLALVVLTNWLGAFALAMAVASYLLARSEEPNRPKTFAASAGIGCLSYALACPWILPSTLSDIRRNAQFIGGHYPMGVSQLYYGVLVVAATIGLRWVLGKLKVSLCLRFSSYFLFFTATLVLTAEWFGIHLMPQPERYHLEMEMAICLVAVFGLGPYFARLPAKHKKVLLLAAVLLVAAQVWKYREGARDLIRPIDMSNTVEFQVAKWLQRNLPGQRVYATGSVQFWLNAFADSPQIGGGFGQGVVNPQIPIVHFGLSFTKNDGNTSATWLRVFGASAVVVSEPQGRDAYKQAWRDAWKFQGVLPELWREGGDVIYGVPRRSDSLAHVIHPQQVVRRSPINNLDLDPVREFDAALSDPTLPLAEFMWERPGKAIIRASLQQENLVAVQISHHPGWRASVNGQRRPIKRDGLGFMVVEPACDGPCEIQLVYDGGTEMLLARIVRGMSILAGIFWFVFVNRKRIWNAVTF
jgi:hypothetical protein